MAQQLGSARGVSAKDGGGVGRKNYMTGRGQRARLLRCNRLSFGRVPSLFGLLCSVHPRIKRAPPSPHGRAAMPCTGGTTRPIFAKSMAGQSTPPGQAHDQRRLPPRQGRHSGPGLVAAMAVSSRRRLYPVTRGRSYIPLFISSCHWCISTWMIPNARFSNTFV